MTARKFSNKDMTKEHAKELLPIIIAFANGENVQTISFKGEWIDALDLTFHGPLSNYRIAPKSRKTFVNEYLDGSFTAWPTREIAVCAAGVDCVACHEIDLPPLP